MSESTEDPITPETDDERKGEVLMSAVERLVDAPYKIVTRTDAVRETIREKLPTLTEEGLRDRAAERLIAEYSSKTAIGGGIAGLASIVPGAGSVAALVGGQLFDMTICLKWEVELVMALAHNTGFDIEDDRERYLCFLIAGLQTYQELAGKNAVLDVALLEGEAIWRYSPRQLAKIIGSVLVRIALLIAGRRLIRAIPFVGAVVGYTANRLLTERVGQRAHEYLKNRAAERPENETLH